MNRVMRMLTAFVVVALILALGAIPKVHAQDPVKLTMLGNGGSEAENKLLNSIIDDFNKSQSEIVAEFKPTTEYDTALQTALASGQPPDVIWVAEESFLNLAKAGALQPIGDKVDNPDDFYPALKDAFTYNNQFYCPPKDFSTMAMQINTDMFEAAGLKAPTTWDELATAAKTLSTDDVAGIVINSAWDRWGAFLYQAGGSITDDNFTKMTINSPEAIASLKFYADLYANGGKSSQDLGAGWQGEAFGKGQAAIAFEGNWIVPYLKDQFPDLKYQSIPLPAGPAGQSTLIFTVCYAVPAKATHPAESIKFINYLVGKEGMTKWTSGGIMPSRISLGEEWTKTNPDLKVYLDSANFAHKWQFVPGFNLVGDKANEQISLLFAGQTTPEDAVAAIEKAGNDVLARNPAAATSEATDATMEATAAP